MQKNARNAGGASFQRVRSPVTPYSRWWYATVQKVFIDAYCIYPLSPTFHPPFLHSMVSPKSDHEVSLHRQRSSSLTNRRRSSTTTTEQTNLLKERTFNRSSPEVDLIGKKSDTQKVCTIQRCTQYYKLRSSLTLTPYAIYRPLVHTVYMDVCMCVHCSYHNISPSFSVA